MKIQRCIVVDCSYSVLKICRTGLHNGRKSLQRLFS